MNPYIKMSEEVYGGLNGKERRRRDEMSQAALFDKLNPHLKKETGDNNGVFNTKRAKK